MKSAVAIALLSVSCLAKDPFPTLNVSAAFGLNINFTGNDAELDRIAAAGCLQRGIRPLYILDYGNSLYESGNTVRTTAGRAGFAAYARAAAAYFKGKGILWEIWNEPNGAQFWHAPASTQEYLDLVKAAAVFSLRTLPPRSFRSWLPPCAEEAYSMPSLPKKKAPPW